MTGEEDAELRQFVEGLIPVVKRRVIRALERSPEDVVEELNTLANLFVVKMNLGDS